MSLNVLVVDDSKTIRMIVKKAFSPYDCEVIEAENGVEGLAVAAKIKPDLIVLDITMPVMNGIEMLGKLREQPDLKNIPVIMLTAESGKDNVMRIVKMGVKDYIVKPFKGEQLIERAQSVVNLVQKTQAEAKEDSSGKYFSLDGDVQIFALPDNLSRAVNVELEGVLQPKIKDMKGSGINKTILDISKVPAINVSLVKLIILIVKSCEKSGIRVHIAGSPGAKESLKGFAETVDIPFYNSTEEAKAAF
ncbi:MAG TPA: response regulator [Desulfobacteraceae bacterium]|nr:response regulator [Desulfobacteraceae bacterium]